MENRSIHDDVWLAPWDPEWAHEFHMEKQCIVGSMMAEEHSAFVRHVGSTAIEGMPAKPMFDRLGRREDETPFVVQCFVQQGIEVWSTREGEQRFDTHVDKLLNYIRFWQASGESEKTTRSASVSGSA